MSDNRPFSKNRPAVSVIVPIYNGADHVPACVDSIRNQTLNNIQILLVNDGSTDHSGMIIDRAAKQDERIEAIHQKNQGVAMARNRGLEKATGKYIAFCDADDTMEPDMLEILEEHMRKTSADVVMCNMLHIVEGKENAIIYEPVEWFIESRNWKNTISVYTWLATCREGYCTNKMYRKAVCDRYGIRFEDAAVIGGEDALFNLVFFFHAEHIALLPQPLYRYYRRAGSIMNSVRPKLVSQHTRLVEHLVAYIDEYGCIKRFENAFPYVLYHFYTMAIRHNIQSDVPQYVVLQQMKTAAKSRVFRVYMRRLSVRCIRGWKKDCEYMKRSVGRRSKLFVFSALSYIGLHRAVYHIFKMGTKWKEYKETP